MTMRTGHVCAAVGAVLATASMVSGAWVPSTLKKTLTTFLTVDVPLSKGQSTPLTLRFDIGEADSPCGRANVSINDQELAQDGNGNGHATLAAHTKGNFTANWALGCRADTTRMALELQIVGLNDQDVSVANVSSSFIQTGVLEMWEIHGADVVSRIDEGPREMTLLDRLHSQIHELDALRIQARKLYASLLQHESRVSDTLGQSPRVGERLSLLRSCASMSCILEAAGVAVKDTVHEYGAGTRQQGSSASLSGDAKSEPSAHATSNIFNVTDGGRAGGHSQWGQHPLGTGAGNIHVNRDPFRYSKPKFSTPVIVAIALSTTILVLVATILLILLFKLHRRNKAPPTEPKPHVPEQNSPSSPSEKQSESLRTVLNRWAKDTTSQINSSSRSRSRSPSNTMQEELASFREAISVVDSLVAAEEGRNREPCPRYVTGHEFSRGMYDDDEESLPPYESEDESRR